MNRSYNLYSAGTGCGAGVVVETPNLVPFEIAWNDGPNSNALYVQGLQHKTWYRTDYYDYVNGATIGEYLSTTCLKTNSDGWLKLKEHPELTVRPSVFDTYPPVRPIVWFVTTKASCNKSMESDSMYSDESIIINDLRIDNELETTIYPNPFHDEVTIYSQIEDEYSVSSVEGLLLFEMSVQIGENKLTRFNYIPGVYIFKSKSTGKTFKLTKM